MKIKSGVVEYYIIHIYCPLVAGDLRGTQKLNDAPTVKLIYIPIYLPIP